MVCRSPGEYDPVNAFMGQHLNALLDCPFVISTFIFLPTQLVALHHETPTKLNCVGSQTVKGFFSLLTTK